MNYFIAALKKCGVFEGRARPAEFWQFTLFKYIFTLGICLIAFPLTYIIPDELPNFIGGVLMIIFVLYFFCLFIASISTAVRRLHDTGRSGIWYLIGYIPYVGIIILIVLLAFSSEPGTNKYGPSPIEDSNDTNSITI